MSDDAPADEAQADEADDVVADEAAPLLDALPVPRRRWRRTSIVLITVTALLSLATAWSLRGEVSYALSSRQVLDLDGEAPANRFVRTKATLDGDRAITFKRLFDSGQYRLAPVEGAEGLWVQYQVPKTFSGARFVAPSLVAGRYAAVSDLGLRYQGVASKLPVDGKVLIDGDDPTSGTWVLALELLLLSFAAWNLRSLWRLLRPIA